MNQNENPLLPDELHPIYYKSDNGFAKQNNEVGDWKAGVTVPSQQAIAAGYFNPQNSVPPTALLGNDTSADGLAFLPLDTTPANLRGDALIARWNNSDVAITDPVSGTTQVFASGFQNPLAVLRDPFGNMLVGENTGTGRIFLIANDAAAGANPIWNGTADAAWATAANWSSGLAPAAGDTATFDNDGNGNIAIATGDAAVQTIVFDSATAAAYRLSGGTITFSAGGGVTVTSTVAADETIGSAIVLGNGGTAAFTFTNDSQTRARY